MLRSLKEAAVPGLVPKSDFIGIDGRAHLAAGGETPFLESHR